MNLRPCWFTDSFVYLVLFTHIFFKMLLFDWTLARTRNILTALYKVGLCLVLRNATLLLLYWQWNMDLLSAILPSASGLETIVPLFVFSHSWFLIQDGISAARSANSYMLPVYVFVISLLRHLKKTLIKLSWVVQHNLLSLTEQTYRSASHDNYIVNLFYILNPIHMYIYWDIYQYSCYMQVILLGP